MRFDLKTHESLILLAGLLGLVEQEAARLLFSMEPSSLLSGAFVSLVLASIGLGTVRGIVASRRNGNSSDDSNGSA
jgi:hypothetical protein